MKRQILQVRQIHVVSTVVKFIETEGRIVVTRGWGKGERGAVI